MSFEEMVVALVGALGAFALVGYLGMKIIDLIKSWINRGKSGLDEETFERLAKAFMQHKKDTERRLQNLEAIVTEEDEEEAKQLEEPHKEIEVRNEEESDDRNLRNMLRN